MSLAQPYTPVELSSVEVAFPAQVSHLMPAEDEIPQDFWRNSGKARPWIKFQQDWFFSGLPNVHFKAKEGIDAKTAFMHLKAIQGSFEPKHEYKEAAVAFLASQWFDEVPTYDQPARPARA